MTLTRRDFLKSGTALSPGAAARAASRPNILLLFPDQWRYDWMGGAESLPVRTPHLDALARRGMRFTRTLAPSPLCAPARACLAAGKEYTHAGVAGNHVDYPLGQTTFYQLLRRSGYHVMGCGKFDLHKATADWGLDGRRLLPEWGFSDGVDNAGKHDAVRSGAVTPKDPYMAYLHRRGLARTHVEDFRRRKEYADTFPTPLDDEAYCDNWLSARGLELLRRAPAGRPWFLQVNFTGPHSPMDITRSMEKRARGRRFPQPNGSREFTPQIHNAIRENYTAMVENIDRWVGRFLDEVRRRGELGRTLVVFSSDHGEMLGDHNMWGKSLPYHPSVSVPLVVAGPEVRAGVRSKALVSVIDLAATFLDYAGIGRPADMDSLPLGPLLAGRTESHREFVLSALRTWRVVWDGRYKLVTGYAGGRRNGPVPKDAPPLLFDLEGDPLENHDLAARQPKDVARLLPLAG